MQQISISDVYHLTKISTDFKSNGPHHLKMENDEEKFLLAKCVLSKPSKMITLISPVHCLMTLKWMASGFNLIVSNETFEIVGNHLLFREIRKCMPM